MSHALRPPVRVLVCAPLLVFSLWIGLAAGESSMFAFTPFVFVLLLAGQGVDEPLSETGFRQAAAAGVSLSHMKFTHVFASDLLRAKQASTVRI